jgi:type I restriction enzyme S subunit
MFYEKVVGYLPVGWKYMTLGEACALGGGDIQTGPFGSQLHASDYVVEGIPSIMPKNIGDNRIIEEGIAKISDVDARRLNRYLVHKGDIVYSRRGDVERRALVKEEHEGWLCGTGCLRIRLGEKGVDPTYASLYLGHPAVREWISRHAHGATMLNLNTSILAECPFVVPPKMEQKKIAHILGTLYDKIELNRHTNETLEAMARALFKSWFVDFDPVRAKMDGRKTGLPKHIADLFPNSFVDSELGKIPKGWEIMKLSELCTTQYGYTARATDEPIGPKYLRVTDMNKRDWIEWKDVPYCIIDSESRNAYTLAIGDIVVSRMADPGKSAIIEDNIDAVFASYLVRLKTVSLAQSYFIFYFLKSDIYQEYAEGAKSGSVQSNMNAKVIVGITFVVPQLDILESFVQAVLPFRKKIAAAVRESRTLAALRDTLLPKLISGELRVKDAERFIGKTI